MSLKRKLYLEVCLVGRCVVNMGQRHSDVRVEHHELKLDIVCDVWNPTLGLSVPGGNIDSVAKVVKNLVVEWADLILVTLLVLIIRHSVLPKSKNYEIMLYVANIKNTALAEVPGDNVVSVLSVSAFAFLEEFITEQVKRAGDDCSGVVSSLNSRDEDNFLTSVNNFGVITIGES